MMQYEFKLSIKKSSTCILAQKINPRKTLEQIFLEITLAFPCGQQIKGKR